MYYMKKIIISLLVSFQILSATTVFAADNNKSFDIEAATAALYDQINNVKSQSNNDKTKLDAIAKEIAELKATTKNDDVKAAIDALSKKLEEQQAAIDKEASSKDELMKTLKTIQLQLVTNNNTVLKPQYDAPRQATADYLVQPKNSSQSKDYLQDAVNAQGWARMVFSYAPQQIYKIYSKIGYLTDIQFQEGETIQYVGGGDTAHWILDKSVVGDTPHLYIKPVSNDIATNIIVNTNKHVYQLLLQAADWYNPMIAWSYGNEQDINKQLKNMQDNKVRQVNGINPQNVNFNYKVKGVNSTPSWMPSMVFNDGKKTYIKFNKLDTTIPALFIKDDKKLSLANYRREDNVFIVEGLFKEAVLQSSEKDIVSIKYEGR